MYKLVLVDLCFISTIYSFNQAPRVLFFKYNNETAKRNNESTLALFYQVAGDRDFAIESLPLD